jgi:hypothetical protein
MTRTMAAAFIAAMLVAAGGRALAGDTGTYRILSYRVDLTPRSDGTVAIDYYQRWLVTGGHIPWITVGTPNGNFTVARSGGAAISARSASGGGWSGVRLDLDRDYRAGETFDASFSIVQRKLFYAEGQSYKLNFTPGWYDRAVTDTLRVAVKFFASLETVTAEPGPSLISGDEMIWYRYGLGPGERFSVRISIPMSLMPAESVKNNVRGAAGGGGDAAKGVLAFVAFGFLFFIVLVALIARRARYSGGRIFYGGIYGGRSGGGRSGGGRSAGGGGGFGGASMSCACACVSCACACACAGGGGAGCARKLEHECPVCARKRES